MTAPDVVEGLTSTPKWLSPIWFYDERGSALFDEITRLPEYYPTRAERALLEQAAPQIDGVDVLVELGSGTSEKTRVVLDAIRPRCYVPLDVDGDTLAMAAKALRDEYPDLEVAPVVGDFLGDLDRLPRGGHRLVAFLGSTIGNLVPDERHRFFAAVAEVLTPADRLLLGADLVKDPARLVAAYDDAAGVTAEFNRNALRNLNRAFDGDLDPDAFEHVARWDADHEWIEMRLRARSAQVVRLGALDLEVRFEAGEELRTEISAKFRPDGLAGELAAAGFEVERSWGAGGDFLLVLARPQR